MITDEDYIEWGKKLLEKATKIELIAKKHKSIATVIAQNIRQKHKLPEDDSLYLKDIEFRSYETKGGLFSPGLYEVKYYWLNYINQVFGYYYQSWEECIRNIIDSVGQPNIIEEFKSFDFYKSGEFKLTYLGDNEKGLNLLVPFSLSYFQIEFAINLIEKISKSTINKITFWYFNFDPFDSGLYHAIHIAVDDDPNKHGEHPYISKESFLNLNIRYVDKWYNQIPEFKDYVDEIDAEDFANWPDCKKCGDKNDVSDKRRHTGRELWYCSHCEHYIDRFGNCESECEDCKDYYEDDTPPVCQSCYNSTHFMLDESGSPWCTVCLHSVDEQGYCDSNNCLSCDQLEVFNEDDGPYYLFFDTETTGVPDNWNAPITDFDNWPRIVQIAWLIYDREGNQILKNQFIIKPDDFVIPSAASNIHQITTEHALRYGESLEKALLKFEKHCEKSKYLIAHNINFDAKVTGSEFLRILSRNPIPRLKHICTMESSTNYCRLPGNYGYKWPTLSELHIKLFGVDFDGAHDALADIQATAKCFWELKKIGVVHLPANKIAPISKSLMEKLKKALLVGESKNIEEVSVDIGGQIWIQRNLDVDCFRNGDLIQEAKSNEDWQKAADEEKPAWCYYDNDPANGKKYGKLYNWYAVNDPRGLAPEGWSIPTTEEWEILRDELGENYITKIIDCADWLDCPDWIENSDEINDSGFSGLPGGGRMVNGVFYNNIKKEYLYFYEFDLFKRSRRDRNELGKDATWWTSSECFDYELPGVTKKEMAKCFMINDFYFEHLMGNSNIREKGKGFSVRCIKPKKYNNEEFLRINGKIWMKNNLNVERFRNGDIIFEAKTDEEWKRAGELGIPAWCYYKNDNDIGRINGKLYNWFAVNDPRGLAPEGWRVPSKQDWLKLESFYDWRWEHDDDPQFHPTWILWKEMRINTEGYRGPVDFDTDAIGYCLWWTSTIMENDDSSAYIYNYEPYWSISLSNSSLTCGIYVRCIEDI